MLPSQLSDIQIEKKKKRRGGKKEQLKRQRRQERETLQDNMDPDDTEAVDTPAFETRDAGAKGLGLFATRNIEPGERLIEESPLFILPKQDTMNAAIVESFMRLLRSEQRAAYLSLSSYTTCAVKTQAEAVETSAAEDGATSSPDVGDSGPPIGYPAEQVDRRICASDVQPLPSSFDIETSCKSPNVASGSGDPILKESDKLELSKSESTTPVLPALQARVDIPIWNVDDLKEALQATINDSGTRSGVDRVGDTADDGDQQDRDSDMCEITESLAARVVNIWRTNSYMLDDGITLDSAGVGLSASRLNHSCVPNVYTAYNSTSGCMTVQALKPIAAGDELCTAYINGAAKLRSERHAQLSMWGFTCTCIACADGRDESRRRNIKTLMAKVEGVKQQMLEGHADLPVAQIEQTVGDLLDQAALMSDEGLLGPDLADVCFGAARCCMLIGRREEAGALKSSGFGILLRSYGIDNPICIAALQAGDLDEA